MKSKRRRISLLFWISFFMYLISLILPYSVRKTENYSGNHLVTEKVYDNGIEVAIPVLCLVPVAILVVLIYVKHTNATRWASLIISSLMIFPALPLLYFATTFCLWCVSYPSIGFYVNCLAFMLFLITAIVKFRIPTERTKQTTKVDVLDDF